jgi:ubiquinone biosynthesis protein
VKELGLHEWLSLPKRLLGKEDRKTQSKTLGERIRTFLEELGPTFVKLGQFASTRSDLFPQEIIQELEKLQDHVPPFSFSEVQSIIEQELGGPLDIFYAQFDEHPLAAASIGQVHYATLHSGEAVAVKVQRPSIRTMIETDLEILSELAELAQHRLKWAARFQVGEIVQEFSKAMHMELDYTIEGRNAERIGRQFISDPHIIIPKVYWPYTTKKVLTMEYVQGIKVNELHELDVQGLNRQALAERMVQALLHQIFIEGFFHGDPHPGNILVLPDEKVVFLDFGMVGRLTSEMKDHFVSLVIALMRQSTEGVINAVTEMGVVPEEVNMHQLTLDVDQLRDKYYDVPLSQVSIGEAVNDLFAVAYRHHIKIPAELTLLGKALLTIEGVALQLDPELSIVKVAEPFGRRLLKERYHPVKMMKNMMSNWMEFADLVTDFPKRVQELTAVMKKGRMRLEITVPDLDRYLAKLDRISNQLSFSIVLLAFSIIMVGLMIGSALGRQSTLLWTIPAIEIGLVVAILMFVWLIYAIMKSGKF